MKADVNLHSARRRNFASLENFLLLIAGSAKLMEKILKKKEAENIPRKAESGEKTCEGNNYTRKKVTRLH